jgi:hypothetical protein
VLIGQLLDAVVVRIQPQAQHAKYEDAPLLHSRATRASVGLALSLHAIGYDFLQHGKDSLT